MKGRVRGLSEIDTRSVDVQVIYDTIGFGYYGHTFSVYFGENGSYSLTVNDIDSLKDYIIESDGTDSSENRFGLNLKIGKKPESDKMLLRILRPENSTKDLRSSLVVGPVDEESSVYKVTVKHTVSTYAIDYANGLLESFLEYSKAEKKNLLLKHGGSWTEQLEQIGDSLAQVEKQLTKFKTSNKIINPERKGQMIFDQYQKAFEETIDLRNQLAYLGRIDAYLVEMQVSKT